MQKTMESLWVHALDVMKDEMSEIGYNTWIKPIKPIEIKDEHFFFEVPVEFTKGMIETRYYDFIRNAIRQVSGSDMDISFSLPSNDRDSTNGNRSNEFQRNGSYNPSQLLPEYTFENFVIGKSNRFAHAAAVAVAEAPGYAYNPLFLYGNSGLGKTHLMHAIGHYILKSTTGLRLMYVKSENFTNELINAIKDDKNKEFREKYRNVDILLMDDIQFIAGKESTQEEFFHTFNSLYEERKQIIISSDNPPGRISTLDDRLRSRFEQGLLADIQPPDYETRVAILRKKAISEKILVPNEVMEYIASNFVTNIRNLQGALTRVLAYSSLTDSAITISLAENVLKDIINENGVSEITIPFIIDIVCKYYKISPKEMISKTRSRDISYPRQIAMYLCRKNTPSSLPQIGKYFGGRDHTTVIHAFEKIKTALGKDKQLYLAIEELNRKIGE
ncbi:MAG: chromosomal replication initiator protein DnaA [Clostridia bacterium]